MALRKKQWIFSIVALFPLVCLASVYIYVLRMRIHLGHWPSTSDGMAKYMPFALFHHNFTIGMLLILPLVLMASIIFGLFYRCREPRFKIWIPATAWAVSILLCVTVLIADPSGFILWFID